MAERERHPNAKGSGFNRAKFIGEPAPDNKLPDGPMDPVDAHLLIEQELLLNGDPRRTWRPSSPPGWARTSTC